MYYLLNLIKCSVKKTIIEKNTGKWEKILEKSGNFVSPEKWEPCSFQGVFVQGGRCPGEGLCQEDPPWTEIP